MTPTPPGSSNRAAPMPSAAFVWRPDGRPDWRSMWESFCDLALHGGPPHRGPGQALRGPGAADAEAESDPAMLAELHRGIRETTGLFTESPAPGWIAVACESRAMAEWLAAAIALENVEAIVEAERLLLPAGPRFRLENEVKSIITVVAKTHHYWTMHLGDRRPLRVGVGGPGENRTALIDALLRRYGRRRAVVASPSEAMAVNDHAVDLVLVDVGEDGEAPGVERETLDATIVVGTGGGTKADLARLERDAHPVAFVDLASAEGVDVIVSWLQRELRLEPWRERRESR